MTETNDEGLSVTNTDMATGASTDDRNIAAVTHISGIFCSFVIPLVVWFFKKDDSPYVGRHSAEALNFQITMLIAHVVAVASMWFLVGFALLGLVWVLNIVLCIVAALKATKGEDYRYPFSLRLVQ